MKKNLIIFTLVIAFILLPKKYLMALEPGALLYRTTSDGKMFGYSSNELLETKNGVLVSINPGHVGIYIGEENGEHYVVEAVAGGVVKTPAKYFVNNNLQEKFIGAKLPKEATMMDRLKAVKIAKSLVGLNLGYDFDFFKQKGPGSGEWTCVGLTEKVYESVKTDNPANSVDLEYNQAAYGINITPDGFDNYSVTNPDGDCLSTSKEFSKIARRQDLILPLPEVIGFNAGLEFNNERYIFLPYTQYVQETLKDVLVDIPISDSFTAGAVRGKTPGARLLLRWSLINNPLSTVKNISQKVVNLVQNTTDKILNINNKTNLVIDDYIDNASLTTKNEKDKVASNIIINKSSKNDYLELDSIDNEDLDTKVGDSKIFIASNNDDKDTIKTKLENTVTSQTEKQPIITESQVNKSLSNKNNKNILPKEALVKLSSSTLAANSQSLLASVKEEVVSQIMYKPSSDSISQIIASQKPQNSSNNINSSQDNDINQQNPVALISKIYATDNNDFIELYNPTDYDFDLAEASFRLEKSKTAEDPSLMMRIGDLKDGYYPGGTIIKSKGYYLIVRDDASEYYINRADAIATRSEFSWTSSSYIIYLGKGAISSSSDSDMIDAVGFGAAKYFQGTQPALAISDNYFLDRVSNLCDNYLDFKLSAISDPSIVWEDNNNEVADDSNNTNNDEDNDNDSNDNDSNDNDSNDNDNDTINDSGYPNDFIPFSNLSGYNSDGVSYFRNFSECYGEHVYSVGRFDCSLEQSYNFPNLITELSQVVDLNNFTLSFYYRNSRYLPDSARLVVILKNETGQGINLQFEPLMLQIEGLPNSAWRYTDANLMPDEKWHHFLVTVNGADKYWAVYIDGQEKYRHLFVETLISNIDILEIKSGMGSVSVDEFAIWNKSLSVSEISDYVGSQKPLLPVLIRPTQLPASLQYIWDFNEGHENINEGGGLIAVDQIANLEMNLPPNSWIWRGVENTGIANTWDKDIIVNLPTTITRQDLSLSFWWRSQLHPHEGRSLIILRNNTSQSIGIAPSRGRVKFIFNDQEGIFLEGDELSILNNDKWHHFAVTYDSYRYLLKLYIDGEEKKKYQFFWIKETNLPTKLVIHSELNMVELDDLAIWEGTLTASQVETIFTDTKVENH